LRCFGCVVNVERSSCLVLLHFPSSGQRGRKTDGRILLLLDRSMYLILLLLDGWFPLRCFGCVVNVERSSCLVLLHFPSRGQRGRKTDGRTWKTDWGWCLPRYHLLDRKHLLIQLLLDRCLSMYISQMCVKLCPILNASQARPAKKKMPHCANTDDVCEHSKTTSLVAVQLVFFAFDTWPGGQFRHSPVPGALVNVPAAHALQELPLGP
jgi:hypothetical protein